MLRDKLRRHTLLIVLIVCNLLFAAFFGSDFGESWDDQPRYDVALKAVERFSTLEPSRRITGKGPIYYVFAKLGGDVIQHFNPGLTDIQSWHYMHFLTFVLGVAAFYAISLRFLTPMYAAVAAALFNTQPVLFGHAFINPKDIPFMSSFLLVLAAGLYMVDQLGEDRETLPIRRFAKGFRHALSGDWSELNRLHKSAILVYAAGSILSITLLIYRARAIQQSIQSVVNHLAPGLLYRVVDDLAGALFHGTISGGISLYNVKSVYPLFVSFWTALMALGVFGLFVWLFPQSFQLITGCSSREQFFSGAAAAAKSGWVFPAAIILGLSVNNRSLSITAGVFVLFYLWMKKRRLFLPTSLVYLGIAFLILYLTWPGMWGNPITGLVKSFLSNTSFSWGGRTLFRGQAYKPEDLPFYYLPYLMAVQFTIPAVLLALVGVFRIFSTPGKNGDFDRVLFLIFAVWYLLPYGLAILLKPAIYHNFRHFSFITPPIFFFAGLGVKYILGNISREVISLAIMVLILAPGISGIIQLHPYQYIYYNSFVGGMGGAFRSFENDYWLTSYQECAAYLNQAAGEGDAVILYGPLHLVDNTLRPDLELIRLDLKDYDRTKDQLVQRADFAIISSRMNHDLKFFPDNPTIFSVHKQGAVLSVVKNLK